MNGRRSAIDMLRSLPAVFDLRDMAVTLDMSRHVATNTCSRWVAAGMLRQAGPRTGVFFNLIADPDGPDGRQLEAVRKVIRRPVVLVGGTALHAHGWTTQRHQRTEIAVPMDKVERTVPKMNGILSVGRNAAWFASVLAAPRYARNDDAVGYGGFPLPPVEWVIVDCVKAKKVAGGMWKPTPSDLEMPSDLDAERVMARIERAAGELGADLDQVREFVSEIDGLEDAAGPRLR